jgi:hypothetical protein
MTEEIPAQFDTEAFREAWGRWCKHKRFNKPYSKRAKATQLNRLKKEAHTPESAIAAIEYSMDKDWDRIFADPGFTGNVSRQAGIDAFMEEA